MHRTDGDANVAGLFDAGDPLVPRLPTQVDPDWLNAVQEEIVNVILAAGVALVKGTNTQLASAVVTNGGVQSVAGTKSFLDGVKAPNSGTGYSFTAPNACIMIVNAAEFVGQNLTAGGFDGSGDGVWLTRTGSSYWINASPKLPAGATITGVSLLFRSFSGTNSPTVRLQANTYTASPTLADPWTRTAIVNQTIAVPTAADPVWYTATITAGVQVYSTRTLNFSVEMPATGSAHDLAFLGARIDYTQPHVREAV